MAFLVSLRMTVSYEDRHESSAWYCKAGKCRLQVIVQILEVPALAMGREGNAGTTFLQSMTIDVPTSIPHIPLHAHDNFALLFPLASQNMPPLWLGRSLRRLPALSTSSARSLIFLLSPPSACSTLTSRPISRWTILLTTCSMSTPDGFVGIVRVRLTAIL